MRVAVVSYSADDTPAMQEISLWQGLDDVIAELVCDHDATREAIENRVDDAIEIAFEDKASDD